MHRAIAFLAALLLASTAPSPASAAPDWVVTAQQRLNHLGCHAGPADGEVGQWTRSAVIRFQSREGVRQSGHLDARTRQRLADEDAPRCDVRPVPGHSGSGRRIVVSQHQNWVWLVGPKGGVADQGPMVDNPSVLHRGSYGVGSYCGRAARIKLNQSTGGDVWLDDFVRFAPCGIGFHRIPRSKATGRQIHADWLLGTNLASSHGCIRLSRELSKRVWDFTTRRTPVRVV
ncbi:L,D-transpeptidase family protein [Nocardioides sp. URHA0032]|uniref:L,D-transpeptidase family protein n=1 Tax=Nocardioides sp. URHA0032 TaxID=1380388 RepID=UPI00048A6B20|nr:L,D-transpeptidase family protein [Nocardioides sp. URHA0032]